MWPIDYCSIDSTVLAAFEALSFRPVWYVVDIYFVNVFAEFHLCGAIHRLLVLDDIYRIKSYHTVKAVKQPVPLPGNMSACDVK